MNHLLIFSGLAAILLSLTHLFVNRLTLLRDIPRSKWLSVAGGISVTYIFIHVLPELEEWQELFTAEGKKGFLKHHLYLVALTGLAVFYGLERAARLTGPSRRDRSGPDETDNPTIFWIHILFFTLYNLLIGYLLIHRDTAELSDLVFFTLAMLFHFAVNDHGLHDHYAKRYHTRGRWIVSGAILLGWFVGLLVPVSETGVAIVFCLYCRGHHHEHAQGRASRRTKEQLLGVFCGNFGIYFAVVGGIRLGLLIPRPPGRSSGLLYGTQQTLLARSPRCYAPAGDRSG